MAVISCLPAAMAEPVSSEEAQAEGLRSESPETAEQPVDTLTWLQQEAQSALLAAQVERDRQAVIQQGWQTIQPTWIQGSATVNLGDFPTLDDPTARAEQDLKTLEWLIQEQRRLAAGQPRRGADHGDGEAASDSWLRRLLPGHWIAALKANREWVAAGGTALLVIVWATAAFSRRPVSGASASTAPATPAPSGRTRRRRRSHHGSSSGGSHTALQHASLSTTSVRRTSSRR